MAPLFPRVTTRKEIDPLRQGLAGTKYGIPGFGYGATHQNPKPDSQQQDATSHPHVHSYPINHTISQPSLDPSTCCVAVTVTVVVVVVVAGVAVAVVVVAVVMAF